VARDDKSPLGTSTLVGQTRLGFGLSGETLAEAIELGSERTYLLRGRSGDAFKPRALLDTSVTTYNDRAALHPLPWPSVAHVIS
jgi:hypothetical protein